MLFRSIKDKTAMKLYNIRDEIKAKIEAKKALETIVVPVEEKLEKQDKAEYGELVAYACYHMQHRRDCFLDVPSW